MTKALRTALVLGIALAGTAAQAAQAAPTHTLSLADLRREEAGLQDRIARLELDRLVARVDATMPDRHARPAHVAGTADSQLAAYAY